MCHLQVLLVFVLPVRKEAVGLPYHEAKGGARQKCGFSARGTSGVSLSHYFKFSKPGRLVRMIAEKSAY
jgi:hypothetical protein